MYVSHGKCGERIKISKYFKDLCKKPRKRRLLYILQLFKIIKSSRFLIYISSFYADLNLLCTPTKHGLPDVVLEDRKFLFFSLPPC